MKPRAFSYKRFSTAPQGKGDSTRRQLVNFDYWCEQFDHVPDDTLTFEDFGVSAFKGRHRKEGQLSDFLRLVEEGKIPRGSALVVESSDRLTREPPMKALGLFTSILASGINIGIAQPPMLLTEESTEQEVFIAVSELFRGHRESKRKSEMLSAAWKNKRDEIAEGKKLTAQGPSWLKLNKEKTAFEVIEWKAEIVRRIFRLMIEGLGTTGIARLFNEEGVKPIGRSKMWHRSYVIKILNNRAVFGEYQPHEGHAYDRTPIGPPIAEYFPAIVKEEDFYKAQSAKESNRLEKGPNGKDGKVSNLFTGLVRDVRDGATLTFVDKGKKASGPQIVSSAAKYKVQGAAEYVAFSYTAFEEALLHCIAEIQARDLLPPKGKPRKLDEELDKAEGQLATVEGRIADVKKKLQSSKYSASLLDVLEGLDQQKDEAQRQVERLKAEVHSYQDDNLKEAQDVVSLLESADVEQLPRLRRRLKALLKKVVANVWILPLVDGLTRLAYVQIEFRGGGYRLVAIRTKRGRPIEFWGHETKRPKLPYDLRLKKIQKQLAKDFKAGRVTL